MRGPVRIIIIAALGQDDHHDHDDHDHD